MVGEVLGFMVNSKFLGKMGEKGTGLFFYFCLICVDLLTGFCFWWIVGYGLDRVYWVDWVRFSGLDEIFGFIKYWTRFKTLRKWVMD